MNYKEISLKNFLIGNLVDISEEFDLIIPESILNYYKNVVDRFIERYPELSEKNFVDILGTYRNNFYKLYKNKEDINIIGVFIDTILCIKLGISEPNKLIIEEEFKNYEM